MRRRENPTRAPFRRSAILRILPALVVCLIGAANAQTDCTSGNGVLDTAPPKSMSVEELVKKFGAAETKAREARTRYTFTQDVMVQTLSGTSVDGQFHEITAVSYDSKGKRVDNVTFSEQSTLRGVQLSPEDADDIRVFMPLMITTEDLPDYTLTYGGQQHVDDLDTYMFHIEPKKLEKNKRYFQGRFWIDEHDLQIVKACGKSVPDGIRKKNQPQDVRPTFVTYSQPIGEYWFPAFVRVDETLHFNTDAVHVRETIKFKDYKLSAPAPAKP